MAQWHEVVSQEQPVPGVHVELQAGDGLEPVKG